MTRWLLFVCCLIFLHTGLAGATPFGNIGDPGILQNGFFSYERPYGLFASLEADLIYDRSYKDRIGDFTMNTFGSRIGAIVRDNMMVYTILGAAKYDDSKRILSYQPPEITGAVPRSEDVNRVRIDTGYDFVYGAGVSAVLYELKVNEGVFLRIGLNASYLRRELIDDDAALYVTRYHIEDPTSRTAVVNGADYRLELNDYYGAVGVSYQIDNFVPYFGFSLSESRGYETVNVPGDTYYFWTGEIEADEHKGFFAGISVQLSNTFTINAEARTRNEDAFTFSAQMRF